MRKNVLYSLFILLFCVWVYKYLSYKKSICKLLDIAEKREVNYRKQIKERETVIYAMRENIDIQIQNEGLSLDSNIIINEGSGKISYLKNVIQENCLIVRLGETNCQPCVNALMTILQKQKVHRIIFLVDYENELFIYNLRKYRPQSHFYKRGLLPLPIDSLNIPYLFVLDKDLVIKHLFIPNKEMLDQTTQYLRNKFGIL